MRYLLLYYGDSSAPEPSPEEAEAELGLWLAHDAAMKEAGVHVAGEALQPVQTATTVRVRGEERVVTDGPFAETREVLGGHDVVDVPDLDAALAWAARSPAAASGSVEIRPVLDLSEL